MREIIIYDKELNAFKRQEGQKLSCAERKFRKLLNSIDPPITDKKIGIFYGTHVRRCRGGRFIEFMTPNGWDYEWKEWVLEENIEEGIKWFDRMLGRFVRKNLLRDSDKNLLS